MKRWHDGISNRLPWWCDTSILLQANDNAQHGHLSGSSYEKQQLKACSSFEVSPTWHILLNVVQWAIFCHAFACYAWYSFSIQLIHSLFNLTIICYQRRIRFDWPTYILDACLVNITCYQLLRPMSYIQYDPVTMIVPDSGQQIRCIPWVQMGTFNKEIGFLCR